MATLRWRPSLQDLTKWIACLPKGIPSFIVLANRSCNTDRHSVNFPSFTTCCCTAGWRPVIWYPREYGSWFCFADFKWHSRDHHAAHRFEIPLNLTKSLVAIANQHTQYVRAMQNIREEARPVLPLVLKTVPSARTYWASSDLMQIARHLLQIRSLLAS